MSLLEKLNESQKGAAEKIEGPLLILAGAGSGKTRTITYRIAYMIEEEEISPYNILAVTFTNKAAKEMKERVETIVPDDGKSVTVATFHSFGLRILRIYAEKLGYGPNFTIYDADDQKKIISNILKDLNVKDSNLTPGKLASTISKLKEGGVKPEKYEKENEYLPNSKIITKVYKLYMENLVKNNGMDFSDILVNALKLLEDDTVLDKIQDRYKYIMVDEYQDTNKIQYKIIKKIASKYKNICVVGDENQSIYGFRGADLNNILDFEKDYPNSSVIKLEENYRSTSTILDAANAVIKNNKTSKHKTLWTKKNRGHMISVINVNDGRAEVSEIIKEITKLKNQNKKYSDITILYRTNAQSRIFEEGFLKHNIPYKIFSGMQFYMRAEIKDILAYLSVINNPVDDLNLLRIINVPRRKIGDKTIEKLTSYSLNQEISLFESLGKATSIEGMPTNVGITIENLYNLVNELKNSVEEMSVSELCTEIIKKTNYKEHLKNTYDDFESRLENLEELQNSIAEMEIIFEGLTLREYLENVSLVSATDNLEEGRDYIKLMTIHNSKGLEFPIVFLVGMENEIFPGVNSQEESAKEEERRLFYVAVTRAEERLYLTHSDMKMLYGRVQPMSKSVFIDEIPDNLKIEERRQFGFVKPKLERSIKSDNFITLEGLKKAVSNNKYKIGERLLHKKFGLGKVLNMNDKKITLEFIDGKKEIALIVADKFLMKP